MNILFLAPHHYYIDRGTPIDDDLMLRVLSERGYAIDLLTYHGGRDVHYPNLQLHRIPNPFRIGVVEPGFSWKKIVCDFFFFIKLIPMLFRKRYELVHAVEEAVFFALAIRFFFGVPYLYDMDSSIAEQIAERFRLPKGIARILFGLEKLAVRNSLATIPVCRALGREVSHYDQNKKHFVLEDISILDLEQDETLSREALPPHNTYLMYTGNLEKIQGIDLLLEGFEKALRRKKSQILILVGGSDEKISNYKKKVEHLEISDKVYFWGRKPVRQMASYLSRADILISPRLHGKHTPMKIYSYLHSGKPVIATRIESHTQSLTDEMALWTEPTPESLAEAILRLSDDGSLRKELGAAGRAYAEKNHSFSAYRKKIYDIYDWVEEVVPDRRMVQERKLSLRGNHKGGQ